VFSYGLLTFIHWSPIWLVDLQHWRHVLFWSPSVCLFLCGNSKKRLLVDFQETWGTGRLWAREDLVKLWKVSVRVSAPAGRR